MARRWLQLERALEGQIDALAQEVARIRADGGTVTRSMLLSMDRYHRLLAQLQVELARYTQYAADTITTEQQRHAALGIEHAARAIELAGPRSIVGAFDRLPVEAIQLGAGLMGDGSPLSAYLRATWGDAAEGMTDELLRATALGQNPRQTARRMQDGTTRSLNRMLNTARTEQLRVYRAASREQMAASGVVSGYKRIATHDSRVCAACLMDEGHEYGLDETMPEHNQGRCLTPGTVVYGPPVQAFVSRRYVGQVVEIRTASGKFLSVTPNHPVLTSRGWVAAQFIQEGDNVVTSFGHEGATGCIDPDKYQVPTVVEDIPRSLNMTRSRSVPVSPQDFHGDGEGSDVYVVWANGFLGNDVHAARFQPFAHVPFGYRGMTPVAFPSLGDSDTVLHRLLASPGASLGDANTAQMFLLGSLGGQQPIGFGLVAEDHACVQEAKANCRTANAAHAGDSEFGFARQVSRGDLVISHGQRKATCGRDFLAFDDGALRFGAEQPAGLDLVRQSLAASVKPGSGLLYTLASQIGLDRVLEVGVTAFSGHVYNLQTSAQWYIANGIITHNCSLVPVVEGMPELTWTQGADWFRAQPAKTQESILGKGRYDAYRAGYFDLDSLISVRRDPTWGDSLQVAPLRELIPT